MNGYKGVLKAITFVSKEKDTRYLQKKKYIEYVWFYKDDVNREMYTKYMSVFNSTYSYIKLIENIRFRNSIVQNNYDFYNELFIV